MHLYSFKLPKVNHMLDSRVTRSKGLEKKNFLRSVVFRAMNCDFGTITFS